MEQRGRRDSTGSLKLLRGKYWGMHYGGATRGPGGLDHALLSK